jgi:hypothetical protein
MPDPILILYILFHVWEEMHFAWRVWKWADPNKKTIVQKEDGKSSLEPVLSYESSN